MNKKCLTDLRMINKKYKLITKDGIIRVISLFYQFRNIIREKIYIYLFKCESLFLYSYC